MRNAGPSEYIPVRWRNAALIANDKTMLHQAALAGLGLIYEFPHHIQAPLAAGQLVTVLEDWTPPFSGFYLYYPSRALMPPKLRVFVDFLKARALPATA